MSAVSILGEDIETVRPRKINKPVVPSKCFNIRYNTRAKTRKFTNEEMDELKEQYKEELNGTKKTAGSCI